MCIGCGCPIAVDTSTSGRSIKVLEPRATDQIEDSPATALIAIAKAARAWRRARIVLVGITASHPDYLARFSDLGNAEHALSTAVKEAFGDD